MPVINLPNIGKIGLIKDMPAMSLPLGAFTRAENVRFTGRGITRAGAWNKVIDSNAADPTRKLLRHITPDDVEELYEFKERGAVFFTTGDSWEDATASGHINVSGDATATSTSLALLPYFAADNYPVIGRPYGPATRMQRIMDGTPHEDSTWRVVRSHKDRLFVFNETTVGNVNPQRAQWSAPVGNRELATDWDTGSPSSTAGWSDLVGFRGEILDAYPLGEFMYVYGTQGVSRMWESGDEFIFNNSPVLSEDGILGTHCVVPVSEYGHFVVGRNQIYIFDGQQAHPIALNRVEDEFRRTLDTTKLDAVFVYPDYQKGEIWVCYPSMDTFESYFQPDDKTNRALVWDFKNNLWHFRDIPNLVDMVTWSVLDAPLAWSDMDDDEWGSTPGTWGGSSGTYTQLPAAYCKEFTGPQGTAEAAIIRFDHNAKPGNAYTCPESVIERAALDFKEAGFQPWTTKHLRRASFEMQSDGSTDEVVNVGFGARLHHQGPWTSDLFNEYDPQSQSWVNTRLMGQQIGYRVVVEGTSNMNLTGVHLQVEEVAQR